MPHPLQAYPKYFYLSFTRRLRRLGVLEFADFTAVSSQRQWWFVGSATIS
jgi:hypothetical protein